MRDRSMPFSPASLRANGVTVTPPIRAGPKLRSGVRTSRNSSMGAEGVAAWTDANRAALIPAQAGIQFLALGPRFRGDERWRCDCLGLRRLRLRDLALAQDHGNHGADFRDITDLKIDVR